MKKFFLTIVCFAFACTLTNAQRIVQVDVPGGLFQIVNVEPVDSCSNLVVSGKLNSEDIHILRHLCGYEADCHKGLVGKVAHLDMRGASFVTDRHPYMTLNSVEDAIYGWVMPGYYSGFQGLLVIKQPGLNGSTTKTWGGAPFYEPSLLIAGRKDLHFQSSYGWKSMQGELVDMSKPVGRKGWRRARNRWMTKLKAHKLTHDASGACLLAVSLRKGKASYDMFYKCPAVQTVIMPTGTKFIDGVYVYDLKVKYFVAR